MKSTAVGLFFAIALSMLLLTGCVDNPREAPQVAVSAEQLRCLANQDVHAYADQSCSVYAQIVDSSANLGKVTVVDHELGKTWGQNIKLSDIDKYVGRLNRVCCFMGRDNRHPIIVLVYYVYCNGNGPMYVAYDTLSVYELDLDEQKIQLVLEINSGEAGYQYDPDSDTHFCKNTTAFFDVEVHRSQVTFLLFNRTAPDKISQVEKYILKEEGFVPMK